MNNVGEIVGVSSIDDNNGIRRLRESYWSDAASPLMSPETEDAVHTAAKAINDNAAITGEYTIQ